MWISGEYPHGYSRDRNQPCYVIRKPVWLELADQRRGRNLSPRMNREQPRKIWVAALRTWAGILLCCNRKLWQSCEQSSGFICYISSGSTLLCRTQTTGGKGLKLQGLRGGPRRIPRGRVWGITPQTLLKVTERVWLLCEHKGRANRSPWSIGWGMLREKETQRWLIIRRHSTYIQWSVTQPLKMMK